MIDGLVEVDIAAGGNLAGEGIALRTEGIAGEREDGVCFDGENGGNSVRFLGGNG